MILFVVSIVIGIGDSNAIYTSKIIKIIAIRKNRVGNGRRAEFFLGRIPFRAGIFFIRLRYFSLRF